MSYRRRSDPSSASNAHVSGELEIPSDFGSRGREVVVRDFDELDSSLATNLTKGETFSMHLSNEFYSNFFVEVPHSTSKARKKLLRLTVAQFRDLSTDVYDEVKRRKYLHANPSGSLI